MKASLSHRVPHLALALLAGAALTACAGAQSAQSQPRKDKEAKIKGSLDRPLGAQAGGGAKSGTSRTVIKSTEDDGSSYGVTIVDGEISAEVNGQPVPADQIDRKGNVVIIKDQDGKTIKSFNIGGEGGRVWLSEGGAWQFDPAQPYKFQQGDAFAFGGSEPPPVMLGITMTDVDPAQVEDVEVEADEAFMIDRVIEGLPADQAGLKTSDVVIRINGKKPASQDRFREILKEKKPGDKLELTIVRAGKEKNVSVKLAPFDQGKLSPFAQGLAGAEAPQAPFMFNWRGDQQMSDEARKQIEEALRSLKENPELRSDSVRKHLEQALKSLEDSKGALAQRYYQFRQPGGAGGQGDVIVGDRPGQYFRVPQQPQGAPDRDMARRIERLGDMLERLDKRLDEIEQRLDKAGR